MTRCPACKQEERTGTEGFPAAVSEDMSMFIKLSHMLDGDHGDVLCCVNCGKYFDRSSDAIIDNPAESLRPVAACVDDEHWDAVLSLPPDLLRVIAGECRLGNRVCGCVRGAGACERKAFYLDGYFRNGHMVSSWVEQKTHFADGLDQSSYVCDSASVAICAKQPQAEQYLIG